MYSCNETDVPIDNSSVDHRGKVAIVVRAVC